MQFTINSRKLNRPVTFSIPGAEYIFVDLNGKEGTLGQQICRGGRLMGSTMSYGGNDQKQFEKLCRNWFRSYLKESA